jgi:hypothetical protein
MRILNMLDNTKNSSIQNKQAIHDIMLLNRGLIGKSHLQFQKELATKESKKTLNCN